MVDVVEMPHAHHVCNSEYAWIAMSLPLSPDAPKCSTAPAANTLARTVQVAYS